MSNLDIEELKLLHQRGQRLAGLDLGSKTIGIALSDSLLNIASPSHTIKRSKFAKDAAELLAFCKAQDVFAIVLGLPLNMDGSEGPRVQSTRAFARNFGKTCDLPIVFWDERLSTVAAERAMIAADLSRKKRAEKIDAAAAGFILQGALDRLGAVG
ncbi:MAG: Holliday junction resolvase RuvX [Hyphomicrobiales bacterium]|nr:Holliday junction resolvase RuvX [Hyphomicrobiales bacterium]